MLTAVLPAAVNNGVCNAVSSRFFAPCGKAPSAGCKRIIAHRTAPFKRGVPPAYLSKASSKLIGSSPGNDFRGFGSFLTGAGFAAAGAGCGAVGAVGAAAGATTGDAGAAGFDTGTTAGSAFCCGAAAGVAEAAGLPPVSFRKRDWKL